MGGASPDQMTNEAHVIVERATEWINKPCTSLLGVSQQVDGNDKRELTTNGGTPLINVFKEPLTWLPSNNDDVGGSDGATPPVYIVTGSCTVIVTVITVTVHFVVSGSWSTQCFSMISKVSIMNINTLRRMIYGRFQIAYKTLKFSCFIESLSFIIYY